MEADALTYQESASRVVTMDPHTLEEVLASIEQLGAVCGLETAARELVVAAPCGFDLSACEAQARELIAAGRVPGGIPVWAVDANASFARPGPRLVEGVEVLAAILHPDVLGPRIRSTPLKSADDTNRWSHTVRRAVDVQESG